MIQNSAALLVTNTRKYDNIAPILQELHWLLVHQHAKNKFISTTYKITYRAAPTYFNDLLTIYTQPRNLCSKSTVGVKSNQSNTPCNCNKFYSERAFTVSVPSHISTIAYLSS